MHTCLCVYIYIFTLVQFYPHSVVKNKPPRKALAENSGPFKPTCCVSLIFISFIYIYVYIPSISFTY